MAFGIPEAADRLIKANAVNTKAVVEAIDRNTAMVKVVADEAGLVGDEVLALRKGLEKLERTVRRLVGPPSPRGSITFHYKGKSDMGLLFDIELPQFSNPLDPAAEDVTHGELTLIYDGVDQPVIQTTVTHDPTTGATAQAMLADQIVPEGIMLGAHFDFRDDDHNVSGSPVVMTPFKTDHNVPPPAPQGGLAFKFKGITPNP